MLYGLILAEKNELCQILCLLFKNMHFRHRREKASFWHSSDGTHFHMR